MSVRYAAPSTVPVELLNKGLVHVKPLISATLSYREAGRAFAPAADRSQAMKVLLGRAMTRRPVMMDAKAPHEARPIRTEAFATR